MRLVNGRTDPTVTSSDRGLQFGDGCFTTVRIQDGKLCHLDDHLHRLERDCRRLAIDFQHWQPLVDEMHSLTAGQSSAVLKVIITRGSGGRGYSSKGCLTPTRILSVTDYPHHYQQWQHQGIRLATSSIRLGMNPALAGVKHLNRLEQILIKQQLVDPSCEEALVLDFQGNIVECCAANILWRKGNLLATPLLNYSGVEGTMKKRIMTALRAEGYLCQQVTEPLHSLATADEIIICNALMPVVPVVQVDQWHYRPGEIMAKLYQLGFTAG